MINRLDKEKNDALYEKAKSAMVTWEELWEANKPWAKQQALLKLPFPIDYAGEKWNSIFYMKVQHEGRIVVVPMWARDEGETLHFCIPPKIKEALYAMIDEEKGKDEDSAAS